MHQEILGKVMLQSFQELLTRMYEGRGGAESVPLSR